LTINRKEYTREYSIKYLGIFIDSHLNWKSHVNFIAKKIKRSIGILSKIRYFTNLNILINLYYTLIYPFLIYGLNVWGSSYPTSQKPLHILQKKAMRIITFSKFDAHSTPIFKYLTIIKLPDLYVLNITMSMHKFHHKKLPSAFNHYFTTVNEIHAYNTRLASKQSYSYCPKPELIMESST